jgi:N-acetylmuramoyl-L-alanine amidase-like protein
MTRQEIFKPDAVADSELISIQRALDSAKDVDACGERIALLSALFLGRSYISDPLGGGPDSKEELSLGLDGFDCVTYIETVLSLARSSAASEFAGELREMRYAGGLVDWRHRNHYMTDWVRNNERRGILQDITSGPATVIKIRNLSLLRSLPAKTANIRCFPKRALGKARSLFQTGDVILFASTKKNLDVFHTGFLIKQGNEISLRHATRAAGQVVEQSLSSFMKAHKMAGFILLRPLCHE